MINIYDLQFLVHHLQLFESGQCSRTGLYDIASPDIDTVCQGLTQEQVDALNEWSWKVIYRIMERFDSIREEQSKPTKSPTNEYGGLTRKQWVMSQVYGNKASTKHPELDSNQRPAD